MEDTHSLAHPSTAVTVTVKARTPVKGYRPREYLTEREIERLMKAAGENRRELSSVLMELAQEYNRAARQAEEWDVSFQARARQKAAGELH